MEPFDVCVVGHVTRDRIQSHGTERCGPGGVAYYAALALKRLGHRVAVITRLGSSDRAELLEELWASGVEVWCLDSAATSEFRCEYSSENGDERILSVGSVAEPFVSADLECVSARWLYLGPLTNRDMSRQFLCAAGARSEVALDAQGLVRQVDGSQLLAVSPADLSALLKRVSLLKVDGAEAALLTQRDGVEAAMRQLGDCGPREVILTRGSRGSVVFDGREFHSVDAVPGRIVDATGCGDTYLAAYLSRRLASDPPERAGRFAAVAAMLALGREGALRANEEEVLSRMTRGCG